MWTYKTKIENASFTYYLQSTGVFGKADVDVVDLLGYDAAYYCRNYKTLRDIFSILRL